MYVKGDSIGSGKESIPSSDGHIGSVADESIRDREDWSLSRSDSGDSSDGLVDFQVATMQEISKEIEWGRKMRTIDGDCRLQ